MNNSFICPRSLINSLYHVFPLFVFLSNGIIISHIKWRNLALIKHNFGTHTYVIPKGQEHRVCKLHKSIYGLNEASSSWNKHFDQTTKTLDFNQNENKPCVYKKTQGSMLVFLVLYIDDILLIGNDVGLFSLVNI